MSTEEQIKQSLENKTKSYCVIQKKTKGNTSKKSMGYCITGMNLDFDKARFQQILLLLGVKQDSGKEEKIYSNLSNNSIYKKTLGLNVGYDEYKQKIRQELDYEISNDKIIGEIKDIPINFRLQLISYIMKIKSIDELKRLIKPGYLELDKELTPDEKQSIESMTSLWHHRKSEQSVENLVQEKDKAKKGGTFRRMTSKNIYPIYMKHNRRRTRKHKGGGLPWPFCYISGSCNTSTTAPVAAAQGTTTNQVIQPTAPVATGQVKTDNTQVATGISSGGSRRRKLKRRKHTRRW